GARAGSAARRRRPGCARRSLVGRRLDRWQLEHEGRALPGPGLGPEARSVRLREAAGDREPQSSAPACAVATLERLEDALTLGGGNARAVVDHPDEYPRRRPRDLDAHG